MLPLVNLGVIPRNDFWGALARGFAEEYARDLEKEYLEKYDPQYRLLMMKTEAFTSMPKDLRDYILTGQPISLAPPEVQNQYFEHLKRLAEIEVATHKGKATAEREVSAETPSYQIEQMRAEALRSLDEPSKTAYFLNIPGVYPEDIQKKMAEHTARMAQAQVTPTEQRLREAQTEALIKDIEFKRQELNLRRSQLNLERAELETLARERKGQFAKETLDNFYKTRQRWYESLTGTTGMLDKPRVDVSIGLGNTALSVYRDLTLDGTPTITGWNTVESTWRDLLSVATSKWSHAGEKARLLKYMSNYMGQFLNYNPKKKTYELTPQYEVLESIASEYGLDIPLALYEAKVAAGEKVSKAEKEAYQQRKRYLGGR